MSIGLNAHPILLILCLVAAVSFTLWTYRRTTPRLPPIVRGILIGLRSGVLAIVLFVLFDPIVTRSADREHPPVLTLLVDNSASQTLADVEALRERLRSVADNNGSARIEIVGFDDRARRHGRAQGAADSLMFDGGRTNIGLAIESVARRRPEQNVRAAVLISDGLYNAGRNPIYAAEESLIPIHTVVTGDTTGRRDVWISELAVNEIAYSGTELPVRVRIAADGFADRDVDVSIRIGGSVVAGERVRLAGDGTEQTVDLAVTPQEAGFMQLSAVVSRLEGEVTHQNNTRTAGVRVIDSRRRVLIVAGSPDPDVGAVRQALGNDPTLEIRTLVQRNGSSFYEGNLPQTLEDTDLLVIAGFPHAASDALLASRFHSLLDGTGVPILYLSGRRVNETATRRIAEAVLPAVPASAAAAVHEAQPIVTQQGRSHPVMPAGAGADVWTSLPPAQHPDAGWQPTPDAVVLATVGSRGVDLGTPLISIRNRAGHRTAAVLTYDLWRWRTLPPSLNNAEGLFDSFISNLVQWLTSPEDDRLVRVAPLQERFEGGETVGLAGEVYDERLQPVSDADVHVTIESEDGESFPFTMTPDGNGRYRLDAGALPEGAYTFSARASRAGADLGTDRGAFSVGALEVEFRRTRADASLMRQIAARSGGQSAFLADIEGLVDDVMRSPDFQPRVEQVVQESSLRHSYLLLLLALVLLASEWILRKRSGMV